MIEIINTSFIDVISCSVKVILFIGMIFVKKFMFLLYENIYLLSFKNENKNRYNIYL